MGWWSTNVMGGDWPYDVRGNIEDHLGIDGDFFDRFENEKISVIEAERKKIVKKFNNKLPNIVSMIETYGDDYDDDYNVAYQVLGVMMMDWGVPMTKSLRDKIIKCAVNDVWASEDKGRRKVMKSFINDINKYDNKTPTRLSIEDEGLFGAIAKRMMND